MNAVMEQLNFSGKVVMVTGGASGMGVGIARQFALAGADIGFTYLKHADEAEHVAQELRQLGVRAEHVRMDQGKVEDCKSAVDRVVDKLGRIDVLVNNSGLHGNTPTMELDESSWDTMLNCNLRGMFFCSQTAAKHMIARGEGGAIVSISSINSVNPLNNALHYGAAKAGVEMVTRSLAAQLGQYGIRVNAVAPGLMDSPTLDLYVPGWRERFVARAPLAKPGQPADIGNICIFLSSPMSGWITGQTLIADGGVTLAPCY